jgi:hypothetical protein
MAPAQAIFSGPSSFLPGNEKPLCATTTCAKHYIGQNPGASPHEQDCLPNRFEENWVHEGPRSRQSGIINHSNQSRV